MKDAARKPLEALLNYSQAKGVYEEQLEEQLGSHVGDRHTEATWNDIQKSVETDVMSVSTVNREVREKHWISATSTAVRGA
ncbi:unnamed protein product [Schistosoma margrebowiei]|uniref:Uncharacterized protein n=1 Tax=Schistosoma margrebowiei TaxID=48269 RepID=A0A183LYI4_9TREM|nr:unnamed protein product [Schistosoma margrebowiei]